MNCQRMYKVYHFNSFLKDFPKPQALQALQTISDGIRQYQMISEKIRRIRRCQKNQMISGGIRLCQTISKEIRRTDIELRGRGSENNKKKFCKKILRYTC